MDREEILAKSRAEKKDEGFEVAEEKGRKYGMIAFVIVFLIVTIVNFVQGQSNFAPLAMFFTYSAAESYPLYKFTRKKTYLLASVLGIVAAVCFMAGFIVETTMG